MAPAPAVSELALVLGGAVVKAAVTLWAGGNPFGDEMAGGRSW